MTIRSPRAAAPLAFRDPAKGRLLVFSRRPGLARLLGLDRLARRADLELVETGIVLHALELLAPAAGPAALVLVDQAMGELDTCRLIQRAAELRHFVVALGQRTDDASRAHELGAADSIELDPVLPESAAWSLERILDARLQAAEIARWQGRFEELFEGSPIGLFDVDGEGTLVAANPELGRLAGAAPDELVGRRIEEVLPGVSWESEVEVAPLGAASWSAGAAAPREAALRRADGTLVRGRLGLQPARERSGSGGVLLRGWFVDTSGELALEEAVRRSEALYVELFSAMAAPTLIVDGGGAMLACNFAGELLLGRRAVDLVGRSLRDAVAGVLDPDGSPCDCFEAEDAIERLLHGEAARYLGLRRHDGSVAWVTLCARAVPTPGDEQHSRVLLSLLDDTDQRALRGRVQDAELDAAMAIGAAHDARNLLTVIRAAADLIRRDLESASEVSGLASQIEQAAERANDLVSRFTILARPREPRRERYGADAVLGGLRALLETLVRGSAQLVLDLGAPGATLLGEPLELERAVVNLVVNARQAIAGRGRIRVVTRLAPGVAGHENEDVAAAAPEWLQLTVQDDGCGMSDEVREHATRAYFTTRESAGGSGLGLDNVARLAHAKGGRVEIESGVGRGTAVHLWLPLASAESPTPRSADPENPSGS